MVSIVNLCIILFNNFWGSLKIICCLCLEKVPCTILPYHNIDPLVLDTLPVLASYLQNCISYKHRYAETVLTLFRIYSFVPGQVFVKYSINDFYFGNRFNFWTHTVNSVCRAYRIVVIQINFLCALLTGISFIFTGFTTKFYTNHIVTVEM